MRYIVHLSGAEFVVEDDDRFVVAQRRANVGDHLDGRGQLGRRAPPAVLRLETLLGHIGQIRQIRQIRQTSKIKQIRQLTYTTDLFDR